MNTTRELEQPTRRPSPPPSFLRTGDVTWPCLRVLDVDLTVTDSFCCAGWLAAAHCGMPVPRSSLARPDGPFGAHFGRQVKKQETG